MKQKAFFYTGKTYQSATYTETYFRVSRHIRIDFTPNGDPYFRHGGRRYLLNDFMRIHYPSFEPMTITAQDGERVEICAQETGEYYKPLFIELDEAGKTVRLYRFDHSETDYN